MSKGATKCPSCSAAVEEGADLCLECGEPMGDSPAAKAARAENVLRPPASTFAGGTPVARIAPRPTPPPLTRPAARPTPPPPTKPASPPPPTLTPTPTMPARPVVAKRKWAEEEPEPLRCPGCGVKSHAARCPNCGTKLKRDDD
ncbi:MAG TPA: hypothetical protein VF945_19585 [Polyangia bacterium]